ncbi:MAG: hypothetical protein O2909_12200 [Chloroflexi bacterium]|nr:hypothetical protein [Chloroflexota bacterium]MDA1220181.1 hypothetical protein [Chloroflexota bacterium]
MSSRNRAAYQEEPDKFAKLFKITVLLGVLLNLVVGIPGVLVPQLVLGFIGLPIEATEFWARLTCWLLILLSFMYIPAALQPFRSPPHSWLTVASRWGGVFFVTTVTLTMSLDWRYLYFALGDLIFAIPELIFLALAFRSRNN